MCSLTVGKFKEVYAIAFWWQSRFARYVKIILYYRVLFYEFYGFSGVIGLVRPVAYFKLPFSVVANFVIQQSCENTASVCTHRSKNECRQGYAHKCKECAELLSADIFHGKCNEMFHILASLFREDSVCNAADAVCLRSDASVMGYEN